MQLRTISFVLLSMVLLSACVSKKKYNDLSSAKQRSDAKVRDLSKENKDLSAELKTKTNEASSLDNQLSKLKAEYNDMKNDMLESNARKTAAIEDLNKKIVNLSTDKASVKDSLQSVLTRMNRREQNFSQKQRELNNKLANINKLETAVASYNKQLLELEKTLVEALTKYEVNGAYISKVEGKVLISFDENALFDSKSNQLNTNGKKCLKVLTAVLEKRENALLIVGSNWKDNTKEVAAWELTQKRGGQIMAEMQLNAASIKVNRFSYTSQKITAQKISETESLATALFVQPNTNAILNALE